MAIPLTFRPHFLAHTICLWGVATWDLAAHLMRRFIPLSSHHVAAEVSSSTFRVSGSGAASHSGVRWGSPYL